MTPFSSHPSRPILHEEIHARPPEAIRAPMVFTHIVMLADEAERHASRGHLAALQCARGDIQVDPQCAHVRTEVGVIRVRWELHTEFVTWTFSAPLSRTSEVYTAGQSPVHGLPPVWLSALPGRCITAQHLWILPSNDMECVQSMRRALLHDDTTVGSSVAEGTGSIYTDYALHEDGYLRMVLAVDDIAPRRLGRLVQRLLEIETYRMVGLLGLPVARQMSGVLGAAERDLVAVADAICSAGRDEEPELLNRLTQLAGRLERQHAATHSRFSASAAYFELVDRRLESIREARLPGMQTLSQFIDRRLSPARATCAWSARRQEALSERISQVSNLLRTRVEIEQQQSNRAVLSAMNRRQHLQLKLQATVEGLSIAAITYYIIGLVSYVAKAMHTAGWPLQPEAITAMAILPAAASVWLSMRKAHSRLRRE